MIPGAMRIRAPGAGRPPRFGSRMDGRLVVILPADDLEELRKTAATAGVSVADAARDALAAWVRRHKRRSSEV